MTPTMLKTLALAALALLFPVASAAPPSPELPTIRECSTFQVDWSNCEGYLVCVEVDYDRLSAGKCVADPCPDFACTVCSVQSCPPAYVCTGTARPPYRCDGYVACAQVDFGPVTTRPVCVEDSCPRLECLACPTSSWCDPAVRVCSEFMVDWNYCAGWLVCVDAGWQNVDVVPVCVVNPCSPGLAACFTCDLGCTTPMPYAGCDETISNNYGYVDCEGVPVGPFDWYCVINCPPTLGPWYCHQDTTGRVECWTPNPVVWIQG